VATVKSLVVATKKKALSALFFVLKNFCVVFKILAP